MKIAFLCKRLVLITGLLAIGSIDTTTEAQHPGSSPDSQWLISLPASPVKISLAKRGEHIAVESRSIGNITRVKFGCVAEEQNTFNVVEELTEKSINLPAGINIGPGTIDPTITFFPIAEFRSGKARCESTGTKMAAVDVGFDDNSVWRANR
jgi:hypothetical protein